MTELKLGKIPELLPAKAECICKGVFCNCGKSESLAENYYKNQVIDDLSTKNLLDYVEAVVCTECGGDGKETCDNPNHGFIQALSFHDIGRIGCPVCGHDPKHKVPKGGNCENCNGTGAVIRMKEGK